MTAGSARDDRSRDRQFADYVARRQTALFRVAYLLTGDPHSAQDLVQASLARTFVAWPRIRDAGATDAYVRRVMVNELRSWHRRRSFAERPVAELPEIAAAAGVGVEDRDEMWQLVLTLPPRQRAVVVLRYYEDLPEADCAAVMRCSVGTVKSQTSRALATLRARVDHAGRPSLSSPLGEP